MNNTAENEVTTSIFNVIKTFFNNTFIIDYGIIKDIPADGVVRVAVSVATSRSDIRVVDCVLATFASGNFAVKVKPEINDKVIVLYPKRYLAEMFSEKNNDFLICEYGDGYNMFAGIAFLANQYRPEKYTDFIEITDNGVSLKLGWDAENEVHTSEINIGKNGNLSVAKYSGGEEKSNISITLADTGVTIQDKNGCKIETSSEYLTINGKLKVTK